RQRTPRSSFAMRLTSPSLFDEPSALQHILDPRVTPMNVVLLAELFVEMPDVQVIVLVAVQTQNLFHLQRWRFLPARLPFPFIKQCSKTMGLITIFPAPHRPLTDPQN